MFCTYVYFVLHTSANTLHKSDALECVLCMPHSLVHSSNGRSGWARMRSPRQNPPWFESKWIGCSTSNFRTNLTVCVSLIRTADRHYACELCSRWTDFRTHRTHHYEQFSRVNVARALSHSLLWMNFTLAIPNYEHTVLLCTALLRLWCPIWLARNQLLIKIISVNRAQLNRVFHLQKPPTKPISAVVFCVEFYGVFFCGRCRAVFVLHVS